MSSKHGDILNAVRDKIKTLTLEGIASANIQRKLLGKVDSAIKAGTLKLPAVVVSGLLGSERISFGTVKDDDVGYPCTVAIVSNADGEDLETEAGEERYLLWRQTIREAFQNQRLAAVESVAMCSVEPANIVELNAWVGSSLFVSGMIVRALSRDRIR